MFYDRLISEDILTNEERQSWFPNLIEILNLHRDLNQALMAVKERDGHVVKEIGDILLSRVGRCGFVVRRQDDLIVLFFVFSSTATVETRSRTSVPATAATRRRCWARLKRKRRRTKTSSSFYMCVKSVFHAISRIPLVLKHRLDALRSKQRKTNLPLRPILYDYRCIHNAATLRSDQTAAKSWKIFSISVLSCLVVCVTS